MLTSIPLIMILGAFAAEPNPEQRFAPIHGDERWLSPGEADRRGLSKCMALPFFGYLLNGSGAVLPDSAQLSQALQKVLQAYNERKASGDDVNILIDGFEDVTPFRHPPGRVDEISAVLLKFANFRAYTRSHVALRGLNILAPDVPTSIGEYHISAPSGQRGVVFYVCSRAPSTKEMPSTLTAGSPRPANVATVDPVNDRAATPSTPAEPVVANGMGAPPRVDPRTVESNSPPGTPTDVLDSENPKSVGVVADTAPGHGPPPTIQVDPAASHSRWGLDLSLGAVAAAFNTRYWSPGALLGAGVSVTNLVKRRGLLTLRLGYYFGDYTTNFPVSFERSLRERIQHHGASLALEIFPRQRLDVGVRIAVGGARETLFTGPNERYGARDVFTFGGGPSILFRVYCDGPLVAHVPGQRSRCGSGRRAPGHFARG